MARCRKPTAQDLLRLDAIAKYLKVKRYYPHPNFGADVTAACLSRITPIVNKFLPCTGEQIALGLSEHFCLTFEEVHGPNDVAKLEDRYLKGKREIGFAQLRDELDRPGVDALLFQRMNAEEHEPDRFVAVLNLQETNAKAYWNRFHELSHRIAEPPQRILPLRRHQFEATNPVESLIDLVASEFAFYGPAFRPLVEAVANKNRLGFDAIEIIQAQYAPTASLLSTIKSIVKYWPRPAATLIAEYRGRFGNPDLDQALRVTPQGYNHHADIAGLTFYNNMRVPVGTPIHQAFQMGSHVEGPEHLDRWETSQGNRLTSLNVYTSARMIGNRVYAVLSV